SVTGVDPWFLGQLVEIAALEQELMRWSPELIAEATPDFARLLRAAKQMGFADAHVARLLVKTHPHPSTLPPRERGPEFDSDSPLPHERGVGGEGELHSCRQHTSPARPPARRTVDQPRPARTSVPLPNCATRADPRRIQAAG
ncbi:MAG: hypothetical protein KDH86_04580, partial [Anaerolineae bacterium]|nr:hypothetical protein [Anaerolineae bacterium]